MNMLRFASGLRWWLLAWFVACQGLLLISPVAKAQSLHVVCTSAGVMLSADGAGPLPLGERLGDDCPLCLLGAGLPAHDLAWRASAPLRFSVTTASPDALLPAWLGVSPRARAPPFFS